MLNALFAMANSGGGGAGYRFRNLSVEIEKVENGYIFKLEGNKKLKKKAKQSGYMGDSWESFEASFVFGNLKDGLAEVEGFFKLITKELNKAK
jgi:hypothetical protein